VLISSEQAQPTFDVLPALFVLERSAHGLRDKRTSAPTTDTRVELCDEVIVKRYVHAHGHKLTHN